VDPYDNSTTGQSNNPWRNPEQMMTELANCRKELVQAWKDWHDETQIATKDLTSTTSAQADTSLFIEMMTDTFQDTLEKMRIQAAASSSSSKKSSSSSISTEEEEDLPLDILVDCLQSTMDLFTPYEQNELLKMTQSSKTEEINDQDASTTKIDDRERDGIAMTAHRRHQERLNT